MEGGSATKLVLKRSKHSRYKTVLWAGFGLLCTTWSHSHFCKLSNLDFCLHAVKNSLLKFFILPTSSQRRILTNLTNLAAWLVFAWAACLGEIIFLTQSGSVWCAHYSHAQRSQSSRSLLLSSDVLIHPVPSTQTSHHTALFVPPAFSSISPLLVTFCCHYIVCLYDFILCTQAFALLHTQCLQPRPVHSPSPLIRVIHPGGPARPLFMLISEDVCHSEAR